LAKGSRLRVEKLTGHETGHLGHMTYWSDHYGAALIA